MRAVIPCPDHPYYLWQVLVQATSMEAQRVEPTWVVYTPNRPPSSLLRRVASEIHRQGAGDVQVVRAPRSLLGGYDAAMKPWCVARYLDARGGTMDAPTLYLDPDVVISREPGTWPGPWHGSDTDSYTGPGYLQSKGGGLWEALCGDLRADPVEAASFPGIGAQYVLGGDTAPFWDHVADRSRWLYDLIQRDPGRYHPAGEEFGVQAWCSEMYVTHVAAVAAGYRPTADPALSFSWASDDADQWGLHTFHHDAGVPEENGRDFCKVTHQSAPWRADLTGVSPSSCSSRYVDLIHATTHRWPGLVRRWTG